MRSAVTSKTFALGFAVTLILGQAHAAPSPTDARARTEALVEAFRKVKAPEEGKPLDEAALKANLQAFAELDAFLDRAALVNKPIEPHLKAFTPAQIAAFRVQFWDTLRRIAYPNSGTFLRTATWKLSAAMPSEGSTDVEMEAHLEEEDIDTTVRFHWQKSPEGTSPLRLIDVSFDGASLVVDYQNQFGRIIAKHGAAGLLERLSRKNVDARKQAVLPPVPKP